MSERIQQFKEMIDSQIDNENILNYFRAYTNHNALVIRQALKGLATGEINFLRQAVITNDFDATEQCYQLEREAINKLRQRFETLMRLNGK